MAQSEITRQARQVIVKPGTDLVASMADGFREELQQVIRESPESVTIDLTGVEMVDSVGIGVMIAVYNSLAKVEGMLKVINANKNILNLFRTMRLDRHFTVEGTA
ncbi:STAS domain-containing protein [Desulfosudis oleivorans]|uniref:Anti-sigma-factor antagonist n=1 Tax=Desulfosudis oleivorans (strain DSM 6200 / JCM 39069 / Hxd3) TaxID=96561 RepID=A8ZXB1_DESOH|nr:STAS domain-containing protein [Desulfosudis oleivorans]ABW68490.1 anti-sigma-factor antagonist [Desulfosudis oleivorans Hxd3]